MVALTNLFGRWNAPTRFSRWFFLVAVFVVGTLYSFWAQGRPLGLDVFGVVLLAGAVWATWPATGAPAATGKLFLPMVAVGFFSLAGVGFSQLPSVAFGGWLGVVAYGLVWLLVGNLMHKLSAEAMWKLASNILAGAAVVLLALQWVGDGAQLWGYRFPVETNNVAALFNVAALGNGGGLLWSWAWALWFSGSRSGLAGAVAGGAVLAWMNPKVKALVKKWWWALALAAVVVVANLNLLNRGGRAEFWELATRMWLASPWVGTGINTYQAYWVAETAGASYYNHAHNWFFNTLAEQGALGLGAWAWWWGAVAWQLVKGRRNPIVQQSLAGAVAIAVQSLGETPTMQPYVSILLILSLQRAFNAESK